MKKINFFEEQEMKILYKNYFKQILFLFLLSISSLGLAQNSGFFSVGGGLITYNIGGIDVNSYDAISTGTYNLGNLSTFVFKGGYINTFKKSNGNVCGGTLNYRIYKQGSSAPSFESITLGYDSNGPSNTLTASPSNVTLNSSTDQRWKTNLQNIDVLTTANSSGTWIFEVFWSYKGDTASSGCDNNYYLSNSGNNYKWTFTNSNYTFPTISTNSTVTNITNNSAQSGGNTITSSTSVSAKGVAYGTSASPTTLTTSDGTGTANYTSSLTSLSPQTKYFVRAYATNSAGTGYGSDVTFYTLSNPPTTGSFAWGTTTGCGNAVLNWTGATFPSSGATTMGYILLRSTLGTPSLSNGNGAAPTASAGTTIVPTGISSSTTTYTDNPTVNATYNYVLIPYTWDGTNASTYNYLTGLPMRTVQVYQIGFANLETQTQSICQGSNIPDNAINGKVWVGNLTNIAGASASLEVQFGYVSATTDSDPASWPSGNWIAANYREQTGNDDRYTINGFGSDLSAGTYRYAFRYRVNACSWVYGGFNSGGGGTWNGSTNVSGTLTVNAIPTAPTASATQVFCGSATVANLTATGTSIQWYSASTGGTPLSSSTALVNGNKYYASQTVSGCESPRTEVTVTINALPSVPSATGTTICSGSTATISATSGAGETIDWYASATGGTALLSGSTSYTSPSLTTTTTYYAEARNTTTGCKSATRTAVTVTVRSISYTTTHTPTSTTTCSPGAITVRGEVYAKFITDTSDSQGAPMVAEFGYGTSTDPSTWANWSTATYIGNGIENSNNDLYEGSISGITTNTYYYGFRFRISSGCTYYYAGIGGSYPSKNMRSIVINSPPTTSNAGSNQTVCGAATLAANTPTVGTGTWSVNRGTTAQFSSVNSPTATFTPNAGAGDYILTWTIASAGCTSSSSNVTITYNVPSATLSTANNTQTRLLGNAIGNINYTLSNITSASATGLPPGVTGNLSGSNFTISGTPTTMGIFNYNVMFNTSCGTTITANGSIRVNSNLVTFANIQLPKKDETIPKGSSKSVYAHIIAQGTYGTGQSTSPAITAWIGYTTNATDATNGNFTSGSWVWVPAPYNTGYDSSPSYQITKDEYWVSDFGQTTGYQFSENAGDYYFVSRFQIASETGYIYGGSDGSTANISGGIWNGSNFVARKITVQECATNTWNGSSWSQGTPTIYHKAVIAENYSGNSFEACECEVNSNKTLTIGDGKYVKLKFGLVVNTGGNVIVENDANLIQEADYANNTGNITVKRNANLKRLDYNYWGSPVSGQQLKAFSPGTLNSRFYIYQESNDSFVTVDPTTNFETGKGYAIRASNTAPTSITDPLATKDWSFIGIPNNGDVSFTLLKSSTGNGYNLVANPYPSNINLNQLYTSNNTDITGTFYFWTNINPNPAMQYANYPLPGYYNNYATYNLSGGNPPAHPTVTDATEVNKITPEAVIKPGQGFIVQATGSGDGKLDFYNTHRVKDTNTKFFNNRMASSNEVVDRYRVQLTTPLGLVNTILVAYKEGSTLDFEGNYDAKLLVESPDSFYSKIGVDKMIIQGRGYPLNNNDVVELGTTFYQSGTHTFSIESKEGVFANGQSIYLHDKKLGIYTDIQKEDYVFDAQQGEDSSRFEIVYQPKSNLTTNNVNSEQVKIYEKQDNLVIESDKVFNRVVVYDVTGKLLKSIESGNKNSLLIEKSQLSRGIYLINIIFADKIVNKKISFK